MSLTLNEFAQGIEFLRIKISFDYVREIFQFLDQDGDGEINYLEFTKLTEESLSKLDFIDIYLTKKENKKTRRMKADEFSQTGKLTSFGIDDLIKLSEKKIVNSRNVRVGLDPTI